MSKNDITGDEIKTKGVSKNYEDNFDKIFRKQPKTSKSEKCCDKSKTSIGEKTKRLIESEGDC